MATQTTHKPAWRWLQRAKTGTAATVLADAKIAVKGFGGYASPAMKVADMMRLAILRVEEGVLKVDDINATCETGLISTLSLRQQLIKHWERHVEADREARRIEVRRQRRVSAAKRLGEKQAQGEAFRAKLPLLEANLNAMLDDPEFLKDQAAAEARWQTRVAAAKGTAA